MVVALISVFFYLLGAWTILRSIDNPRMTAVAGSAAALALVNHSAALVHTLRSFGPWAIGLTEAFSILGWTLGVLGCLLAIERQQRALASILFISAAIGAAFTGRSSRFMVTTPPAWELTAHIVLSMAAAALLFAAAVTAILFIVLDRRLRKRKLSDLPTTLPPLDVLEILMFRLIGAGFGLLTLSLFTGFVFVTNLFTQHLVHKTVLSVIAWILFGVLLAGRALFGWRGRPAVRWTLAGFVFVALAYFGSKFVLESVLGRHWG